MNRPMRPLAANDRKEKPEFRSGFWLVAVLAVHALLLSWGLMGMGHATPPLVKPTVIGRLVAPPAAAIAPPKPKAAQPPKPNPKPRQAAKPKPAPRPPAPPAPPSERAVTVPTSEPDVPVRLAEHAEAADAASASAEPADFETASLDASPFGTAAPAAGPALELPRTDAAHLNNPAPVYPNLSRRFGEQGRVLLDVYILPDGSVGDIRLNTSSGFQRLDEAALAAVRHWRFVPARRGNEAIPYWYVQPITFSLDR